MKKQALEVQSVMKAELIKIQEFVSSSNFQSVLEEMKGLSLEQSYKFVSDVWLSDIELQKRKLTVPDGMTIQRSYFADDRPTLFCVSSHMPEDMGWQKITVTIDHHSQ